MTTMPKRTYGWRTWGDTGRDALLGAFIGVAISFFESGATRELPDAHTLVRNIIIGLVVTFSCRGAETALSWAIEQSRYPTMFRSILYATGGWVGFYLALTIVGATLGEGDTDFDFGTYHFVYSLVMTIIGSITIGFVLHHNRKRSDRLRESVARLKEHEFAEKELEIARSMQQRLLPPPLIERDGYRVTARTHAAHLVGGDFYDVLRLGDDTAAVLAADVSGKGIAASLIMASCKAMVPFLASTGSAAEMANALNVRLNEQLERREFVAMVFARFDINTGEMEIMNAGMPDPLLITTNGEVNTVTFEGERLPLGAMRATRYTTRTLTLQKGERLVLFSDGLPEALLGEGHLGYERVESLVREMTNVDALVERLLHDPSLRVEDDLTVVMLERV